MSASWVSVRPSSPPAVRTAVLQATGPPAVVGAEAAALVAAARWVGVPRGLVAGWNGVACGSVRSLRPITASTDGAMDAGRVGAEVLANTVRPSRNR